MFVFRLFATSFRSFIVKNACLTTGLYICPALLETSIYYVLEKQNMFRILCIFYLNMVVECVPAGKDHESSLRAAKRIFYILIISCLLQSDYHVCSLCRSFIGTGIILGLVHLFSIVY